MAWLAFASMLLGLACVPLLDPVSSHYLQTVGRARRVRRLRDARPPPAPDALGGERVQLTALIQAEHANQLYYAGIPNPSAARKAGIRASEHAEALRNLPAPKPVAGTREG